MSMTRHATVRTEVTAPDVVAGALRPDNTAEMETRVDRAASCVVTDIERDSTGGLRTTVDDYVVNLTVATEIVKTIDREIDDTRATDDTRPTDDTRQTDDTQS